MAAIVLALLAALTSIALMPLFKNLPQAVLAAIVINAVMGFVSVSAMRTVRALRRDSFYLALTALIGVLVLGILPGLLITVLISVVLALSWLGRPNLLEVAPLPGSDVAVALQNHPEVSSRPGLLVLRPSTLVLFANAGWIRDGVAAAVEHTGHLVEVVVLDLEASDDLDVTSVETFASLQRDLAGQGAELWLSNVHAPARIMLERAHGAGVLQSIPRFDTVGQASDAFASRSQTSGMGTSSAEGIDE
jgi:MFS superfamily sulfate permease-like transporter